MISTAWFTSAFLAVILSATPSLLSAQSQEDETDAHGYDKLRIEQEDKLLVPLEIKEEVWNWLRQRYAEDQAYLAELDPRFTASWSEELFTDTYFDTPSMQLYAMKSGVRKRHRVNLSNPEDVKSGRELMQIKLNDLSDNVRERGEIKFDIEYPFNPTSEEDRHPMLGMVKPDHRELFKKRLSELGLDPMSMKPVLTVVDTRRRIYLKIDGKPFMSISHDNAKSDLWWGHGEVCEIEPELNEIGFTEADAETRAYMETVLDKVVADILTQFPAIQRDLTPKYNKFFDRLEDDVPFLRTLVKTGTQSEGYMYKLGALAFAVVGGAGWLGFTKVRSTRKKTPGPRPTPATV